MKTLNRDSRYTSAGDLITQIEMVSHYRLTENWIDILIEIKSLLEVLPEDTDIHEYNFSLREVVALSECGIKLNGRPLRP